MQANNILKMRSNLIQHQTEENYHSNVKIIVFLLFNTWFGHKLTNKYMQVNITAVCVKQIPPISLNNQGKSVSFNSSTGFESLFLPCPWHNLHLTSLSGMYRKKKVTSFSPFTHRSLTDPLLHAPGNTRTKDILPSDDSFTTPEWGLWWFKIGFVL